MECLIMDTLLENTATSQSEAAISPQDGFLFIGELAKLTGTDPKTIRFYERAELISPPRHGRFRTYLASDVRRLKNVLTLRRLGVPIAQIRDILDVLAPDEDVLASEKAINLLRQHLDLLKNRHTELTQQIEKTSSALHSLVA
jgi:MerR family mercuric resistance operon transcriptional regulator